jgi:hypothetical protein
MTSVTGIVLMGCGLLLIAVAMVKANAWLRIRRAKSGPAKLADNTVEASTTYRRCLVAAAWAGGSQRDWDHSVRPLLSEVVEVAVAERHSTTVDPIELAREQLGDRLWALVDRNAARSDDRSSPGAGRAALVDILDRVEQE